jgi:hypothetical protein
MKNNYNSTYAVGSCKLSYHIISDHICVALAIIQYMKLHCTVVLLQLYLQL